MLARIQEMRRYQAEANPQLLEGLHDLVARQTCSCGWPLLPMTHHRCRPIVSSDRKTFPSRHAQAHMHGSLVRSLYPDQGHREASS
ncbi:hypothetical protein EYF80_055416 [Liparis tanakae]|uniref:Uncharacterized protein n=1 Tax=Liparis tanakae TaxID=230148 RepID=A0A4Z2F0M0_9TELE|nr:hypothetical protein EYF80_055416 [Liparis tanakae]